MDVSGKSKRKLRLKVWCSGLAHKKKHFLQVLETEATTLVIPKVLLLARTSCVYLLFVISRAREHQPRILPRYHSVFILDKEGLLHLFEILFSGMPKSPGPESDCNIVAISDPLPDFQALV